jgi:hypothetical protein
MDTRPPTVTSRALTALSAAIELGDARQVALAAFDAVLSGATRDEVEQLAHGAPAPRRRAQRRSQRGDARRPGLDERRRRGARRLTARRGGDARAAAQLGRSADAGGGLRRRPRHRARAAHAQRRAPPRRARAPRSGSRARLGLGPRGPTVGVGAAHGARPLGVRAGRHLSLERAPARRGGGAPPRAGQRHDGHRGARCASSGRRLGRGRSASAGAHPRRGRHGRHRRAPQGGRDHAWPARRLERARGPGGRPGPVRGAAQRGGGGSGGAGGAHPHRRLDASAGGLEPPQERHRGVSAARPRGGQRRAPRREPAPRGRGPWAGADVGHAHARVRAALLHQGRRSWAGALPGAGRGGAARRPRGRELPATRGNALHGDAPGGRARRGSSVRRARQQRCREQESAAWHERGAAVRLRLPAARAHGARGRRDAPHLGRAPREGHGHRRAGG